LPDPVGEEISRWIRPCGIEIVCLRVPIGVVGVAFESRPLVVAHAAAICMKIGNAALLVGDGDTRRTGTLLLKAIQEGLKNKQFPDTAFQAVFSDNLNDARELSRMQGLVDVLIARGSATFVSDLVEHSTLPVLKHLESATHLYVDKSADLEMAAEILRDARFREPYACHSTNTVLLHRDIAAAFTEQIKALTAQTNADVPLTFITVQGTDEAIQRINGNGAHIADVIVAEDIAERDKFLRDVDSACLFHNASPRFANGCEFGMGAEIGFSSDKLHARGPISFEALTSTKYIITGKGQTRD